MFSSGQEARLMYILVVLVEAFARLTAKLAAANHLSKKRLRTVLRVTSLRLKYFHDSQNNVQTYQVAQFKRSHRMVSTQLHSGIDTLYRSLALSLDTDSFVDHRDEDTVYYETSALFYLYRDLADLFRDLLNFVNNLYRSV